MKVKLTKKTALSGVEYIEVSFTEHKVSFYSDQLNPAHLNNITAKLNIIDRYLGSYEVKYDKKQILSAWSKVDSQLAQHFKKLYPQGGKRENAGRKPGFTPERPKSNKTERFTMAISTEEKIFLVEKLKEFRRKNPQ